MPGLKKPAPGLEKPNKAYYAAGLPTLLAGAILVGGEWLFSQVPGIELAGALASALVIAVLAIWGRVVTSLSKR